ncbi:MAG TPA: spermidine synthase [Gallionella sp.]|nr:spermidine synthase [Gallionella sp.]
MATPINISEEAGVRYLHFGSDWIQGAMRIARPWNLELEYTREMMASLLLREDSHFPRKVLLIGLGAASLTKFLYRNYPLAHLTVVEIEPAVVDAARQFFKLPEDPKRIDLVIGDGVDYVLSSERKFDLILVDGYDENASSGALNSVPFYHGCRNCLSRNGILSVNLLTSDRRFDASIRRIAEAFDDRVLAFPSGESGNAIALAALGDPVEISLYDLREKALDLNRETGLNLMPSIARLERAQSCPDGILTL